MGFIYPILQPLKVDIKKKIILFGLFSLGLFSFMCNVAKAVVFLDKPFTRGYIWATTEISVAIICASIPMLRPLFYRKAWIKGNGSATTNPFRSQLGSRISFPQQDIEASPIKPDDRLMEYELTKNEQPKIYERNTTNNSFKSLDDLRNWTLSP